MCKRFIRNREKFSDLVYSLKSFTARGILEKFRNENNGDTVIDGSQTIFQYLCDLKDNGMLRLVRGRFFVMNRE